MTDSSAEAVIFSIQQFSTEDGPGLRTTVFFKGCPMRCPWCHNPEAVNPKAEVVWHRERCLGDHGCIETCPENALRAGPDGIEIDRALCVACGRCVAFCPASALEMHGERVGVRELFDRVARDMAFYRESGGGVTLSGGEPLAQPVACAALLRLLREHGIANALDTCGAATEAVWQEVLPWTDLILFDIKTVDPERHAQFTGVPFDRIRKSAVLINESGVETWVRTPVIPGYTDDEESIRNVAQFVGENLRHCTRHDLLAFSNLCTAKYAQLDRSFALAGAPLLTAAHMERLCAVARDAGSPHVRWSGPTQCAALSHAEEQAS
ncbi:glycyl-radical enzyme activating protein [Roseovarius pacificus]|uniref:glycyl-radical enzyme activating protein n=1 Tax=Roseovarius pacificus TaxID=337701 RepID=UPI002A18DC4F|nr:glycyl-radical enzyme activating protein [Roseovarius pacificus]